MQRIEVSPTSLGLPNCALPRPNESVVWYSDSSRRIGTLVGHDQKGSPVVKNKYGFTQTLSSYDQLRLANPEQRLGPSWTFLDENARIFKPLSSETDMFQRLLGRHIPPGPTYLELIQEIWHRGFEIFLVGGTVRDVIGSLPPHDVDLVTAMPLERAVPLLRSMYRHEPEINNMRGYVRIGGTPASGDPFIDLKAMVHSQSGTPDVIFSSDLIQDLKHRDFACNAVYYDPINDALIDPAGCGIAGAESRFLELVCDPERPPFYRAQVCLRFFKFTCRGFHFTEMTASTIRENYLPSLHAMQRSNIRSFVKRQVLSKSPNGEHKEILRALREAMHSFGAGAEWEHIEPAFNKILRPRRS